MMLFIAGSASRAGADPRRPKPKTLTTRIQGATQMFSAPWGLVAQGSGQLRILPVGTSKWQVVHKVPKGTLYRVAFDDAGRLMAWWEKEPHLHLFVPSKKEHRTLALPPPPSAEFKYGYGVDDLYFTGDGAGAIVYMHGFTGGRTWVTVAYHYDLERRSEPTLLFRQPGHPLHKSSRLAVHAIPQDPNSACEHNSCHPLGAIIGWEISGTKATKRVLLSGDAHNNLSRVQPVWGGDKERIAVLVTEHPHKRHLLRWRWGDAKAQFEPLPSGPGYDTETMWLASSGEVVEFWLTDARGLEIRRHAPKGKVAVTSLAPLPRRTPNDRPLFNIAGVLERANGDLILHWGEYLVLLPSNAPARRLDLRSVFNRKTEFAGRVIHVRAPEGIWVGIESGKALDFAFLPYADLEARTTLAP